MKYPILLLLIITACSNPTSNDDDNSPSSIIFETSLIETIDTKPDRRFLARIDKIVETNQVAACDDILIHDTNHVMSYENDFSGKITEKHRIEIEFAFGAWIVQDIVTLY